VTACAKRRRRKRDSGWRLPGRPTKVGLLPKLTSDGSEQSSPRANHVPRLRYVGYSTGQGRCLVPSSLASRHTLSVRPTATLPLRDDGCIRDDARPNVESATRHRDNAPPPGQGVRAGAMCHWPSATCVASSTCDPPCDQDDEGSISWATLPSGGRRPARRSSVPARSERSEKSSTTSAARNANAAAACEAAVARMPVALTRSTSHNKRCVSGSVGGESTQR
jgi:hypothetical protein